jgi:AcrR family transcriptional regulator
MVIHRGAQGTNQLPRDRAATRERILVASDRLFAEHGYAGVSMPAIAEASGITAGAIYKHFNSKAELFFNVVRRAVERTPVAPGVSTLPELVATYASRAMKSTRQIAIEMHYAAAKDPTVRRFLRRSLDRQMDEVRLVIAAGQAAGALDPKLDPGLLASAVFVFIMGLMHSETLTPQLIGDAAWRDFIRDRTAALIGAQTGGADPP